MTCPLCGSPDAGLLHEKTDPHEGGRRYHHCGVCGLIFLDPGLHLPPDREKARYDQHRNDPNDPDYVRFLRRLADPLCERLPAGARGLDYGSGPGPTLHRILEGRGHPTAIYDPFYAPDRGALERTYDFIACSETIEHCARPRETFERFTAMLPPGGGWIGIMTERIEDPADFASWWYHRDPTHIAFYSRRTFDWIASWLGRPIAYPSRTVAILGPSAGQRSA